MHTFQCGRYNFNWQTKPVLVMGILNVTPDSFYSDSRIQTVEAAYKKAIAMIKAGVDIIDVGAQSTRPGYTKISLEQEKQRLLPVLEKLISLPVAISVDTDKSEIMHDALAIGVDLINDVSGFKNKQAIDIVKKTSCGLCVMHCDVANQNTDNIVDGVVQFLKHRVDVLQQEGIALERILIDPGFGFNKNALQNTVLLKQIHALESVYSLPVLAGLSRKSFIGQITGQSVENRLAGSLAAAIMAVVSGARVVRVHDVAKTVDAIKVWQALR